MAVYLIWWKSYLFFRKDGSLSLVQRAPTYQDQTEEDISSVLFQLRFYVCCQKSTCNGLIPHLQYVKKPFKHESSSSGISGHSLKSKYILSPISALHATMYWHLSKVDDEAHFTFINCQLQLLSLLTRFRCSIPYPEPANFLGARERTGSYSPQIADLFYCIAFQITNQDHLRIGPFQSLRFRRACAVRS